jgi:hypothetical protein
LLSSLPKLVVYNFIDSILISFVLTSDAKMCIFVKNYIIQDALEKGESCVSVRPILESGFCLS